MSGNVTQRDRIRKGPVNSQGHPKNPVAERVELDRMKLDQGFDDRKGEQLKAMFTLTGAGKLADLQGEVLLYQGEQREQTIL